MADPILSLLDKPSIFSDSAMLWVFFFYGLGFIILGAVTFLRKRKIVDVDLTKSFYFLGLFGLTHGITEWIDLSRLSFAMAGTGPYTFLDMGKVIFLTISFLFLMQFGLNMLTIKTDKYKFLRKIPLILGVLFFGYTIATNTLTSSGLLARYGLGFIGSLITTVALWNIRKLTTTNAGLRDLKTSATLMFIAFAVYTLFGGLIITPIAGIPPQFIRMLTAIFAGYASFSFLGILETGLGVGKVQQGRYK